MNALVVFFVAVMAVASGLEAKHQHPSHKHHNREGNQSLHEEERKFNKNTLQTRGLFSDACNFVCGSSGSQTGDVLPSWQIDLTNQTNIGVIVAFEGNSKSLAFINAAKQAVVIFTGSKGIFGIFNIAAKVGIVINLGNGVAKYITTSDYSSVFFGASTNIFAGIYGLANAIYANQGAVTGLLSALLLDANTFNFDSFISQLTTGSIDLYTFFSGKTGLLKNFKLYFQTIFTAVSTNPVVTGGYSFAFGSLNVLVAVLGNVTGVTYGFLTIVQRFTTNIDGFVNGALLFQLFSQVSLYAEAFNAGKITGVSLLADLSLSFTLAGSVLFAIAINGLITVGGIIKGTIDAAVQIIGAIIGAAYIGVGVQITAGISANVGVSSG